MTTLKYIGLLGLFMWLIYGTITAVALEETRARHDRAFSMLLDYSATLTESLDVLDKCMALNERRNAE